MTRLPLLLSILLAGPVFSAESPDHDREFFIMAAAGGIAKVQAGKLAQSKGASVEVRKFGAMMVNDHSKANRKLKAIATRKNIRWPAGGDARHAAWQRELESASGPEFDDAYVLSQVAAHEATLALLKREAETGNDADARAFAVESLPKVAAHLQYLRSLFRTLASAESSPPPGKTSQTDHPDRESSRMVRLKPGLARRNRGR